MKRLAVAPKLLMYTGVIAATLGAAGCAVGPDFRKPDPEAPARWGEWHGGAATLAPADTRFEAPLPRDVWVAFNDPELTQLIERARARNPDLNLSILHLVEARTQESTVTAQRGVRIDASAQASRRRDSEFGASTRIVDLVGGANSAAIRNALATPYSLYRPGFDASWELDLWGRQRRSEESAHASTDEQAASLRQAQLSVVADVARNYFTLRSSQRELQLLEREITLTEDEVRLLAARQVGGLIDESAVNRARQQAEDLRSQAPQLQSQEAHALNQLTQLLGARPGDLNSELASAPAPDAEPALPGLGAGIPSEFARRRPDIQAAEARLHNATASIGVAVADLYPSITLGASFGLESVGTARIGNWGARDWSVGPSLNLPVFDHGRRTSTITLRKLQQQEAAVAYQQTVLKAWHEVDDTMSAYQAGIRQCAELAGKAQRSASEAAFAGARADNGSTSQVPNLEAQGAHARAQRDLARCESLRAIAFVALYKALGDDGPQAEGPRQTWTP